MLSVHVRLCLWYLQMEGDGDAPSPSCQPYITLLAPELLWHLTWVLSVAAHSVAYKSQLFAVGNTISCTPGRPEGPDKSLCRAHPCPKCLFPLQKRPSPPVHSLHFRDCSALHREQEGQHLMNEQLLRISLHYSMFFASSFGSCMFPKHPLLIKLFLWTFYDADCDVTWGFHTNALVFTLPLWGVEMAQTSGRGDFRLQQGCRESAIISAGFVRD